MWWSYTPTRRKFSWHGARLITHRDNFTFTFTFTLLLTQVIITKIRLYRMAKPLEWNLGKDAGEVVAGEIHVNSFHGHSVDAEFPVRQALKLNIRILKT
jgi:hypothetical protein